MMPLIQGHWINHKLETSISNEKMFQYPHALAPNIHYCSRHRFNWSECNAFIFIEMAHKTQNIFHKITFTNRLSNDRRQLIASNNTHCSIVLEHKCLKKNMQELNDFRSICMWLLSATCALLCTLFSFCTCLLVRLHSVHFSCIYLFVWLIYIYNFVSSVVSALYLLCVANFSLLFF